MWLKLVSKHLKLSSNDRVSIYYHVENHFYLLARYSINPEFDKINRQKFPTRYGVISQAWQHKSCVDTMKCPEYSASPQDYIEYMSETYDYDNEKINKLIMKSCEFVAISISDADKHIGVIVFETVKSNRFKQQKIREIKKYCKNYQSYLCSFIRDGISLDKSAKVIIAKNSNTESDFLSLFAESNHE